jgi:hypothetical protein
LAESPMRVGFRAGFLAGGILMAAARCEVPRLDLFEPPTVFVAEGVS